MRDGEPLAPRDGHAIGSLSSGAASGRAVGTVAGDDRLEFLRGFLRHPGQVGSVVPSSRRLEARVVRNGRIAAARTVVELGPGTGGSTRALLAAMAPEARLLAVEIDPVFRDRLAASIVDPRFAVECGSAEAIGALLAARGLAAPEAIVSGIPFSTMPPEVARRIAAEIAATLAPGGCFVAYQFTGAVAGYLTPHFGAPRVEWEFWNIPPMRTYTWVKTR